MVAEPVETAAASSIARRAPAAGWPPGVAVSWLWLRARRAARRLAGLPLWQAWCVHLLAGLAAFVVFTLLIDEMEGRLPGDTVAGILRAFVEDVPFSREAAVMAAVTVGSLELGYLLLAGLVMPWGAADEALRRSFAHALRFTWLHTTHVALVVFLVCCLILMTDRSASPEWAAGWLCCAGALWLMCSLLRAVGTPRAVAPVARPPTCEFCGYNLTATPLEGRCPECGEPAARSLGPDVRPGAPWEHRRELGTGRAYRRTAIQAVFAPGSLGRSIRVADAPADWRCFFPRHLPAVLLLGGAAFVACFIIDTGMSPFAADEWVVVLLWQMAPVLGTLGVAAVAGAQLLAAAVAGLGLSWLNRRNLLPAAMQAAAYLGGYATAAAAFGSVAATAFCFIGEHDLIRPLTEALGLDEAETLLLAWFGLMGAWLCGGLYLTWRITAAARFANR